MAISKVMIMYLLHKSYAPGDSHTRSASRVGSLQLITHSVCLAYLERCHTRSILPTRCKARGSYC
ncbi:hypothetical protein FIBSPDRAFT_876170 [Athelia psychrophila]|uniref:Uncharacterized protein n=1 Tax=Athelia psychrophila TaxID=1759441 RepID=A0A167X530_9AGAM|nr:hypothetical protein FIBSPDRAFT_876170 [Fibularhizoctonia sp. CBS 109695]